MAGDQYFAYNGHGDTTNLLSKNKDSVNVAFNATYDYDAFGNPTESTGGEADNNPFRYNGQYHDDETGLIYLRNRYYDPTTGRFIQEDPAKDGLNWYVYCANNPVNMVDPWGLANVSVSPNDITLSNEAVMKIKIENQKIIDAGEACNWSSDDKNLQKVTEEVNANIKLIMRNDFYENYGMVVYDIPLIQQGTNDCWAMAGLNVFMYKEGITSTTFTKASDIDEEHAVTENDKKILEKYKSQKGKDNTAINLDGSIRNLGRFKTTKGDIATDIEDNIDNGPVVIEYSGFSREEMSHVVTVVGYVKINGQIFIKINDSNKRRTSGWIPIEQAQTYDLNSNLTYSGYIGGGYYD